MELLKNFLNIFIKCHCEGQSAPTITLFYNSNKVLVKKSLSQNDYQSFCSAESHGGGNVSCVGFDNSNTSNPPYLHTSKKAAFSLAELMIIMLVASLITAAMVPIVTKKHFKMPQFGEHGSYMCYYANDGKLHEVRYSNKYGVGKTVIPDRVVTKCVFNPPQKATYFQITAVGGGGGGGDSGYTGGNIHSDWTPVQLIDPFNLTTAITEEKHLKYKNVDNFTPYAGTLYAYARSVGSGAGGDANRVTKDRDCIAWSDYECTSHGASVSGTICEGEREKDENGNYIAELLEGSYSYSYEENGSYETKSRGCLKYDTPTSSTSCVTRTRCKGGTKKGTRTVYACSDGGSVIGGWSTSRCSTDSCRAGSNSNAYCASGTETYDTGECEGGTEEYQDCTTTTSSRTCKEEGYITDYHYGVHTVTVGPIKTTGAKCRNATASDVSGSSSLCQSFEQHCIAYTPYYYNYTTGESGGAGGSGASCQDSTSGDYGLQLEEFTNAYNEGTSGQSMSPTSGAAPGFPTSPASADSGTAYCADGSYSTSCSAASYSYTKILKDGVAKAHAKALSASSGGTGGYYTPEGDHYNGNGTGSKAANGSCSEGTTASTCSVSGKTGYCLKHNYNYSGSQSVEPTGKYRYRYSFDENYLQYGNAGEPGEYKTLVIRSFKDADSTIRIGRGGSAAVKDSGSAGMNGSATTFGKLIYAAGGKGGKGGIIGISEVMPGYDEDAYNAEDLCFNKSVYAQASNPSDPNYANHQKLQQALNANPNMCDAYNGGKYKYHKSTGVMKSSVASEKKLITNLFKFILPQVSDDLTTRFREFGKGGDGGGVTHNCWAGQFIVWFEGAIRPTTSIYPSNGKYLAPDTNSPYLNKPSGGYKLRNACHSDFAVIPAKDGVDGALLIKW